MAERKRGLGRGLDALIPSGTPEAGFSVIPVDHVDPNPDQPRQHFDEGSLEGLAASIREVGVLQPIVVRAGDAGHYQLVAGERRLRAARIAGLAEIPAIIREGGEEKWTSLTEAIVENVQREDLSPLEEAAGYRQLLEDFGWTHEKVAQHVGKSRPAITNTLRLLQLPAEIQALLESGELDAGHGRALVIDDHAYAVHIAKRAAAEGWSVRMIEDAVRARETKAPLAAEPALRPAEIIELEERLAERLGAQVRIDYRNERGKLVVDFGSVEELERISGELFGG